MPSTPRISLNLPSGLHFGPFPITASQAFHISPARLSYSLVNLKPLLPGHVLVCPVRVVPRLSLLTAAETSDLFLTVKRVSKMLERVFRADALNIAVQDGVEAGQSVPHVHVHVIPRRSSDGTEHGVQGDQVYHLMDDEEHGNLGAAFWDMQRRRRARDSKGGNSEIDSSGPDADAKRGARTKEEMEAEAGWFQEEMRADLENDAGRSDD